MVVADRIASMRRIFYGVAIEWNHFKIAREPADFLSSRR